MTKKEMAKLCIGDVLINRLKQQTYVVVGFAGGEWILSRTITMIEPGQFDKLTRATEGDN